MRHIEIQTHLKGKEPNSFTLTVDGENYLYFSELDLLLGFMARVGTCNDENADRSTLMNSLFNVMLGEKYANDIDKLNQTVQRMTERYNDKIKKLDNEIHRFQDAADEYEKFKKKLEVVQIPGNYSHSYLGFCSLLLNGIYIEELQRVIWNQVIQLHIIGVLFIL